MVSRTQKLDSSTVGLSYIQRRVAFHTSLADGRTRVYRRPGERYNDGCVMEVNRFQRGVMVWGAITANEKLELVTIHGNMNARRYIDDVLDNVVVPYIQRVPGPRIFQHDNARPHVARITREYLQAHNVNTLNWPALSPDLSPIEHIWDELGRRVRQRPVQAQTLQKLEDALHEEWRALPIEAVRTAIHSMRRRCHTVIANRGRHTHY